MTPEGGSAVVLGHRGGRGPGWPAENSLAAFQRALDEGADGVELDVRRCATGELVVTHDPVLADGRKVADVAYADHGWATLDEALDLCARHIVNVEVKPDQPRRFAVAADVARVLRRTRARDVVLSSFDPGLVLALAAVAPKTPRAMLVGSRTPRLVVHLPLVLRRAIEAAHLDDALVTAAHVARLKKAGLRVVVWTVNDPTRARALAEMGVEWLITDQPGAIVSLRTPPARPPSRPAPAA